MAHLRVRSGQKKGRKVIVACYAEFYDPSRTPKQVRVSLRTKDESVARIKIVKLERSFAEGTFDPWRESSPVDHAALTVDEAVERFVASREGCAAITVSTYKYVLDAFVRTLPAGLRLAHLDRRHVEPFLAATRTESTRKSYADRLAIFSRWCVAEKMLPAPFFDPKTGPKVRRDRLHAVPRYFTDEEYARLRRSIEADAYEKGPRLPSGNRTMLDAMEFSVGTGLRLGELCALHWSAVSLRPGQEEVTVSNTDSFTTKSGRERTVPLVGASLSVIRGRHEARTSEADGYVFSGEGGAQLNGDYLGKRFVERVKASGVAPGKKLTWHSLRHTFASWAVLRSMDLYRLKELMGHADIKTTLVYARLRPDAFRDEMVRCFGGKETFSGAADRTEVDALRAEVARLQALLETTSGGA